MVSSLLLLLTTLSAAVWIYSLFVIVSLNYGTKNLGFNETLFDVSLMNTQLHVGGHPRTPTPYPNARRYQWFFSRFQTKDALTSFSWPTLGFGFWRDPYQGGSLHVMVPLWFLTALPLSLFVWRRFRTVCVDTRYCSACGYDLRATPERCPECGLVVAADHRTQKPVIL